MTRGSLSLSEKDPRVLFRNGKRALGPWPGPGPHPFPARVQIVSGPRSACVLTRVLCRNGKGPAGHYPQRKTARGSFCVRLRPDLGPLPKQKADGFPLIPQLVEHRAARSAALPTNRKIFWSRSATQQFIVVITKSPPDPPKCDPARPPKPGFSSSLAFWIPPGT
jgi:hypothetical protein